MAATIVVPIIDKVIAEVLTDRSNDRRMGAGIRACRGRGSDFHSELEMRLAGIAMVPEARALMERALTKHWEGKQPFIGGVPYRAFSDRECILGGGLYAAIYAACRVAAGHKPPIVLEQHAADRVGGAFAVSLNPVFRLNSRNRPGPAGLPDQDKALNYIPGAVLQPSMITSEEYATNADMAWLIRLTLAQYAELYPNTEVKRLIPSENMSMDVGTDYGTFNFKRVIDARGNGRAPAGNGTTILNFEQLMQRMGKIFPLKGMRQVAVIGGGDSARCAVESLLGVAPGNT
jgi:hypothetical protein